MPIVRRNASGSHADHDALVAELVRHLKEEPNLPETPRIVEENVRLSNTFHVYVLWDRWETVDEKERSAIILEAYQQAKGQDVMLRITVAMGVTPLDAASMGLKL